MRRLIALALFLTFAAAAAAQSRFTTQTYITSDNAYQSSFRQYAGYEKRDSIARRDTTRPPMFITGTQLAGWRCYFRNGVVTDYTDLRTSVSFTPSRRLFTNLNVSFLNSVETPKWSPVFFDGFVRYQKGSLTLEAFGERESVGTPLTNQLRYVSVTTGISADIRVSRRVTLVNGVARNEISDGNVRWYQSARVILALKERQYVDLKVRRMYGSETSPYYFSPLNVNQYNVGYGFFKPFNDSKIYVKAYVGLGIQEVNYYYMSMFNVDLKATSNFDSRWNGEVIFTTRNFNEYIYNTFSMRIFYKIGK